MHVVVRRSLQPQELRIVLHKQIDFRLQRHEDVYKRQVQYVPVSDRIITYYFYPICYKVETFSNKMGAPSDTFYTLKGGHQVNGLFCDGIYDCLLYTSRCV